jgi:hypothetical protein
MTFEHNTQEAADAAQVKWNHKIDCPVSPSDPRIVRGVNRNGLSITLDLEDAPDRFASGEWEPLQIKALFTAQEWAQAKSAASDTFEALTLAFHPIDSATVLTHLRQLVGSVLTVERFTAITGRAA